MKDGEIKKLIKAEANRQKQFTNLIASENYASDDVMEALGSVLSNKYAEGYPRARYYGGQEYIDQIEELCQKRALELFGLSPSQWSVNVQPYSGSPANVEVYTALVPLGESIMGMQLAHGGHLTHGHSVSFTGKAWKQIGYTVAADTEVLDYDELKKMALEHKPKLIVAGFTAYPRIIDWKRFRNIADACGAYLMVDMSHVAGLVAGEAYPSPFPFADVVMTTTHKTLRGPRGAMIFSRLDERELNKKIDKAVFPGLQGGPHMNQIAAAAVTLREAASPKFKVYAKHVVENAGAMAGEMERLGWRIVSGGTDSHLFLVDTWMEGAGISGAAASAALEAAKIIVNMNTIPFDKRSPRDPSGIRIGTAAETTKGMNVKKAVAVARQIDTVLRGAMKEGAIKK